MRLIDQNERLKQPFFDTIITPGSEPGFTGQTNADGSPYLNASFCHTQNARYRPTMEDASKVITNFQSIPGNGYFAVFDGHAGSFTANWCAKYISQALARNLAFFATSWSMPEILAWTFLQADSKLCSLPEYDDSGCTAALIYIQTDKQTPAASATVPSPQALQQLPELTPSSFQSQPAKSPRRRRYSSFSPASPQYFTLSPDSLNKTQQQHKQPQQHPILTSSPHKRTLHTANVGDSRIVLSRNGVAQRLTRDHKATDDSEAARVRKAGGTISNGRVDGSLAICRAIGDRPFKPHVCARPHTSRVDLDDEDEFLVLACDGVWDVFSDQAVVDLVREIEDPAEASQEVVRHALLKGSTDNITCMVVRLKKVVDCFDGGITPTTSTTEPISIPHSSGNETQLPSRPKRTPSRTLRPIHEVDTALLDESQLPWKKQPMPTRKLRRRTQLQVPNQAGLRIPSPFDVMPLASAAALSPADSDLTISEEDDKEEDVISGVEIASDGDAADDEFIMGHVELPPDRQQPQPDATAALDMQFHHARSMSFSPSVRPFEKGTREFVHDTEVSSLDRYGRFKRSVRLEYDYDGDDCAVADSD